MPVDRRSLLSAGLLAGAAAATASRGAVAGPRSLERTDASVSALIPTLSPSSKDQTEALQSALDDAAARRKPLFLPAGHFRARSLTLRSGSSIVGAGSATILEFSSGPSFIIAENASGLELKDFTVDGARLGLDASVSTALVHLRNCERISISGLTLRGSLLNGISLEGCSGRIADCTISDVSQTGLFSIDAKGLDIHHNHIHRCANNGIQVWRSQPGEDGTTVSGNRIEHIEAKAGGTGQNGNGINVYRANGVLISSNRITDCAYSAIRANSASNIQMVANSCARLGEVALYAEFGFEGALIATNIVETAASGIAVTNFNEGGRLAVVQGNIVRNLFRREHEPTDKRGTGISIEADSLVTGNTIENAPAAGIQIGWGPYMRDCIATQNLIRNVSAGILVSSHPEAGTCLVANNLITNAENGAIRAMRYGEPWGPELVGAETSNPRVRISGNVAV